jgi:hypothetical protein
MLISRGQAQVIAVLSFALALASCAGCNPQWPVTAATARVQGEVTLDGIPIEGAKVVFLPVELRSPTREIMPMAYGLTDAKGKFEMKYSNGSKELMAGKYSVIISKSTSQPTKNESDVKKWETDLLPDDVGQFANFKNSDERFPSIYNRDSILVFEVQSSTEINQPKFKLSSIDPLLQDWKQEK